MRYGGNFWFCPVDNAARCHRRPQTGTGRARSGGPLCWVTLVGGFVALRAPSGYWRTPSRGASAGAVAGAAGERAPRTPGATAAVALHEPALAILSPKTA